jgi:hypothetical protein
MGWGGRLSQAKAVLEINDPHFTLFLYENWLRIDLKGNTKNEIVDALENKPVLKQSIGNILEVFAPLHIHLHDVDSARLDSQGRVKLVLPHRRDITIPLAPDNAKRLMDTLNPLIVKEKEKEAQRLLQERKAASKRARIYFAVLGAAVVLAAILGYLTGIAS